MAGRLLRHGALLLLALVFTVGLTSATVELPHRVDDALQSALPIPGGDSHADAVARLKTELFMAHYHVRAIGYAGFVLLVGLIGAGFATRRTGLAALGAVGVMLPVFAQFAGVMFFLAGLGILNALWLPVLDLSWGIQDWGLVIRAPADLLGWGLGRVGIRSDAPVIFVFLGSGILLFLLGTWAWLEARARDKGVADFWVYRLSRHPQYLGWILWTYGAFLLVQRMHYPRRSWGIGASLPWLLSTMVIVGVAMTEELAMRRRHGEAYEGYRRSAPFLFPLPRRVERLLAFPFRALFRKERPERRREVAVVLALYTALLMALSALFYAGGAETVRSALASDAARLERARESAALLEVEPNPRERRGLARRLAAMGEPALDPLQKLLAGGRPEMRILVAEALAGAPSHLAVPALAAHVSDPEEDLRYQVMRALRAAGTPEAIPALTRLLEDPALHVRVGAFAALAELGEASVLERAPGFLSHEATWVRSAGASALGSLGSEGAIPFLIGALEDEAKEVRREAAVALLRVGSPTARPALERARADPDFEVRIYAAEALDRLPGPQVR